MKTETLHQIQEILFEGETMILKIDEQILKFPLAKISPKLKNATSTQRLNYRISPSGYGIHWMDLDEDLSVEGLLNFGK